MAHFVLFAGPILGGGVAGALLGAMAYAFAQRWPRRRLVRHPRWMLVAIGAMSGGVLVLRGPVGPELVAPGLLLAVLLPIVAIDLELRLIPDVLTLPSIAAWLVLPATAGIDPIPLLSWAAGAAGFFALPAIVSPGSVGWGDVKLAGLLGAALGPGVVWAVACGLLVASIYATGVLFRDGRRARSRAIPLAPALAAGALGVILLG